MNNCVVCKDNPIYLDVPVYYKGVYYYDICSFECLLKYLKERFDYEESIIDILKQESVMYYKHQILVCHVCKMVLDSAPYGVYHDVVTCSQGCNKAYMTMRRNLRLFNNGSLHSVRFYPDIKSYR